MIRQMVSLPEVVTGTELDSRLVPWLSVVVPSGLDVKNLLPNPSGELDAVGYESELGGFGTVSQSSTYSLWGHYSIDFITATAGNRLLYKGAPALVAATRYVWSFYIRSNQGGTFKAYLTDTGGPTQVGNATTFRVRKGWQRVVVRYTEAAGATRWLCIDPQLAAGSIQFQIDGMMLTTGTTLETYVDGDQSGFLPDQTDYYWLGEPHASASMRLGASRAGGEVIPLARYGFRLLALLGLGLGNVTNLSTPQVQGGARYQSSVLADRTFMVVGGWDEPSFAQSQQNLDRLGRAIAHDRLTPDQPLLLHYEPRECEAAGSGLSKPVTIPCVYEGGLPNDIDNLNSARLSIAFHLYMPWVARAEGEAASPFPAAATLTVQNAAKRLIGSAEWSVMGAGFNNKVREIRRNPLDGKMIYAGDFTNNGNGTHAFGHIAAWDRASLTWDDLNSGIGTSIVGLGVRANGDIYVNFAGGYRIYDYSAGTWGAGTGTFAGGMATIFDFGWLPNGNLVVVGDFATIDGIGSPNIGIFDYNTSAWTTPATGTNGTINRVLIDHDGRIYVFGNFTTAGGAPAGRAAYWDGAAWHAMGVTGFDGFVYDAVITRSGLIVAVGDFDNADGILVNGIAQWSGGNWEPVSSGLTSTGPTVFGRHIIENPVTGHLIVTGEFELAGDVLQGGIAEWTGYTFTPLDISNNTANFYVPGFDSQGQLYLGVFYSPGADWSLPHAGVLTVTNEGSARTFPIITVSNDDGTASGVLAYLENATTGARIFFDQRLLTLDVGERIVIDLRLEHLRVTSNYRGDLSGAILPGSDVSGFYLQPGANKLALAYLSGTPPLASIRWPVLYRDIASVAR